MNNHETEIYLITKLTALCRCQKWLNQKFQTNRFTTPKWFPIWAKQLIGVDSFWAEISDGNRIFQKRLDRKVFNTLLLWVDMATSRQDEEDGKPVLRMRLNFRPTDEDAELDRKRFQFAKERLSVRQREQIRGIMEMREACQDFRLSFQR